VTPRGERFYNRDGFVNTQIIGTPHLMHMRCAALLPDKVAKKEAKNGYCNPHSINSTLQYMHIMPVINKLRMDGQARHNAHAKKERKENSFFIVQHKGAPQAEQIIFLCMLFISGFLKSFPKPHRIVHIIKTHE
jgi:hypothetical protein